MSYENKIKYITDVALGFFFFPFLIFIGSTTIKIAEKPASITEGVAILYVALLTGILYILSKKMIFTLEIKIKNLFFMAIGLGIFFVIVFWTT